MKKRILITGASGGFGQLMVKTLVAQGHAVTASMRDTQGKNKALTEQFQSLGAKVAEIDVCNDQQVQEGVAQTIDMMQGLDVLVNNAGVGTLGMLEHFTIQDFQKLFDVNVLGVQRMNRAVVPHFRKERNGLIIYISSLLGRMTLPFYGAYNASKWALEAMAENYRMELSGFGVENCIVEPGGYATSFIDNLIRPSDQSRNEAYGDFLHYPEQMLKSFEQNLEANADQDPQKVADCIAHLISLDKGAKPFRTTVDHMGMSQTIEGYNEQLEQIMQGVLGNFGMAGMLTAH